MSKRPDEAAILEWESIVLIRIKRAIVSRSKPTREQTIGTVRALAATLAEINCAARGHRDDRLTEALADGFHEFADRYIKEFAACERN